MQLRSPDRGRSEEIPHATTHDDKGPPGETQPKEDWATQRADRDKACRNPGQTRAREEKKGQQDILVHKRTF